MMGYKPGDRWFWCPMCGFNVRFSQTGLNWTGQRRCFRCIDDKPEPYRNVSFTGATTLPGSSVEPDPVYVGTEEETPDAWHWTTGAIIDWATGEPVEVDRP